jgi:rhodanese-related sulfurtransferase
VLTGDSLLVGDVARPDLAVAGQQGAEALFASMHEKLLALPDGTLAYPAHVAGSLCGRVTNRMTGTTIGFERRHNPALQISEQAHFVHYMLESLPERPPNMGRIVSLNMATAAADDVSPPSARSPLEVQRLCEEGAVVLDTRSAAAFGAGHIPAAIAVQLNASQFPNRLGLVVPAEAELVLVTSKEAEVSRVLAALAVIGYSRIAGHLAGGMQDWCAAGYPVATLPQISVCELQDRLETGEPPCVVDVRERAEWETGHIAGALHIPFPHVREHAAELQDGGPIALICASGQRSTIAASLLAAAGARDLHNVVGGMEAWAAAGLPTTR